MTLEQEWWKSEGRRISPPTPPSREKRLTAGDVVARVVAYVLLILIFTFSVWALSHVAIGFMVLLAILALVVIKLASRVRELGLQVENVRQQLEGREAPPLAPQPPPEAGAAETTGPDAPVGP